jgi:hypothetical protein
MRQLYVLRDFSLFYCNIPSFIIKPKGTITLFNIEHVISCFRRGMNEVFAHVGHCAASIGNYGRFGDPEGGTYRLTQNVGNLTPTLRNNPEERRRHLTLIPNLGVHRDEYFSQTYIFSVFTKNETCSAG